MLLERIFFNSYATVYNLQTLLTDKFPHFFPLTQLESNQNKKYRKIYRKKLKTVELSSNNLCLRINLKI